MGMEMIYPGGKPGCSFCDGGTTKQEKHSLVVQDVGVHTDIA